MKKMYILLIIAILIGIFSCFINLKKKNELDFYEPLEIPGQKYEYVLEVNYGTQII